jgi:hypothetical protein
MTLETFAVFRWLSKTPPADYPRLHAARDVERAVYCYDRFKLAAAHCGVWI